MDKPVDKLIEQVLESVHGAYGIAPAYAYADSIIRDPQGHIDMLFEAGVLEKVGDRFRVVKPHTHHWKVTGGRYVGSGQGADAKLELWCHCGELRYVDNRIPIEVPDA